MSTSDPPKKASSLLDTGFTKLSEPVYLYEPGGTAQALPTDPKTIAFFSWMGAGHRPILRYISHYQTLYPASRIVVVVADPMDFVTKPVALHHKQLRTALDAIKAVSGPVLVHLFSNGGCYGYSQLTQTNGGPIPGVVGAVIDSGPGLVHLSNCSTPMATSLTSNAILYPILVAIGLVTVGTYKVYLLLTGQTDALTTTWNDLSGVSVLPSAVKRLYIYSTKDTMVYADDVELSMAKAKESGVQLRSEKYKESKHVMHAVVDSQRYWGAVQDLWSWVNE